MGSGILICVLQRKIQSVRVRPSDSGSQRNQHALGEQLAHQARAAGAQGEANCDLPAPPRGARQHHIGDVGTGKQEDQAHKHNGKRGELRQVLRPNGHDSSAGQDLHAQTGAIPLRIRILLFQPTRHCVELGFDACRADSRLQAPYYMEHFEVAPFERVVRKFGRHGGVDANRHPQVGGIDHR